MNGRLYSRSQGFRMYMSDQVVSRIWIVSIARVFIDLFLFVLFPTAIASGGIAATPGARE